MANGVFSYQNWVDRPSTLIASDSEQPPLPSTLVAVAGVCGDGEFWQSTATGAVLDLTFDRPLEVGLLALFGLTAAPDDTVRWRLSAMAPGGGELLDTGIRPSCVSEGYDASFHWLPVPVQAKYARVIIDCPSRAREGFFRCGRVWVGPARQPRENFEHNETDHWVDPSARTRVAKSGTLLTDDAALYREVAFALPALDEDEAKGWIKDMARRCGTRKQIVFIPDPESPYAPEEIILGTLATSSPVAHPSFPCWATAYKIEQSL